ncbi:FAD/NAD-P-binding domain-containing protein [Trametes meyenii]|nr:FAD/NAD-P-binding domain-containing protein [Trametes meyenii]
MPGTKVIIAGAGIAGPVLAMFLKAKGYDPVIYERTEHPTIHGLSLALQTNGLRVLSLIPGLVDKIVGGRIQQIVQYSTLLEDPGELTRSDAPGRLAAEGKFGMLCVRRAVFHRTLLEHAEASGIPIVFGHQLVSFVETADRVAVSFANGKTDAASFLVGCDGLHSNTRECLFGKHEPAFTGLVQVDYLFSTGGVGLIVMAQTGGLSETPDELKTLPTAINLYGNGAHMIAYPVNDHQTSWAVTTQEPEAKETWRAMEGEAQEDFKHGPFSQWSFGGGKLVAAGTNIVKYGLYDRPELQSWYKGRVVLLGDAAHPTSPHLGQGANQAFEDIYHLVRLLSKYNPDAASPPTELLSKVFSEYESLRIERTSALVKRARKQGEIRVVNGVEESKKRNNILREETGQRDAFSGPAYDEILKFPFEIGHSEVALSS